MTIKDVKNLDKDQILEMLGLEQQSSTTGTLLRWLGLVTVGAVVGAAVTLLLAPRSGRELREELAQKIKAGTDEVVAAVRNKANEIQPSIKG
jgi:gas vesicle protein